MEKQDIFNIEDIRKSFFNQKVNWTTHCLNRMNQRNIKICDINHILQSGTIIEYYYEDYPYPSCLILGKNIDNKEVHIVCGIHDEWLYMITAYYPHIDKWERNMKDRRKF